MKRVDDLLKYIESYSDIAVVDKRKIHKELLLIKEELEAINYSQCCETLKGKEAISFGRYCATRGYHKFEGVWVNRQKFPRDIEWIKKQYRKDIFDL